MQGFPADLPPDVPVISYRLEQIGPLLDDLRTRGITAVTMAGALRRPGLDPALIDPVSAPLLAGLAPALALGDDGTLRAVIALFEQAGFVVIAAQDLRPDLLPPPGAPTRRQPDAAVRETARLGPATVAAMGRADSGQACILRGDSLLATEGPDGTDAMLAALPDGSGALLYKAPKPGQDRRADLPVIGPGTVRAAAAAGLAGIVIAAGGVMVIDMPEVVRLCDAANMVLWIRPA
jgi:DUF1009 family protein